MDEAWKDVVGYEGLYLVSNHGNVKSLYTNKILSPYKRKDGYREVILSKNKIKKHATIHRLVAMAFIPNPNNLSLINHKDENPSNNFVDNLEWCDYHYNNTYNGVQFKRGQSTAMTIYQYNIYGELIDCFTSLGDIERKKGWSGGCVCMCCNSDFRTYKGFVWSYKKLNAQDVLSILENNKKSKIHKNNKLSKPLAQFDVYGNFIQTFPSTQEAERILGISNSLISKVCRGEALSTCGYVFKYI